MTPHEINSALQQAIGACPVLRDAIAYARARGWGDDMGVRLAMLELIKQLRETT